MKILPVIAGLVTLCLGLMLLVLAWVSAVSLTSLAYCVADFIGATSYAVFGVVQIVGLIGGIIPLAIFVIAVITMGAGCAIIIGTRKV